MKPKKIIIHPSKILLSIINYRIKNNMVHYVSCNQFNFTSRRGREDYFSFRNYYKIMKLNENQNISGMKKDIKTNIDIIIGEVKLEVILTALLLSTVIENNGITFWNMVHLFLVEIFV